MVSFRVSPSWRQAAFLLPFLLLMSVGVWAESPQESSASKSGSLPASPGAPVEASHAFTPWMSLDEMNAYFENLDGDKPDGKNYWDRGHWLDEVEGRWEAGIPQYRVSHSAVPASRAHWWFWYMNQDRESFDRLVHHFADEGFVLVSFNSYVRPGGSERFQGVWHRLIPLTNDPLLPAGRYRLSEFNRKPQIPWPVSLIVDGDRISGRGPRSEFSGSVKSRFSGTIKTTLILPPAAGPLNSSSLDGSSFEWDFLKLLENATWKEDGNKLRVVKNGETVLRFERDESNGGETPPKQ
jgi:hypothetical protein